jgi:hypothetical protein
MEEMMMMITVATMILLGDHPVRPVLLAKALRVEVVVVEVAAEVMEAWQCSIPCIPSSTSIQPEMYTVILRTFEFLLTTPIPRAPSARGHVYLLVTFYAYFT